MATINVVPRNSKADKAGRVPLYLRLSDGRDHRMRSLGVKVRPSQWDAKKQEVRRTHMEAEEINERIDRERAAVRDEIVRRKWAGDDRSAAAIAEAVWAPEPGEAPSLDFFSYADAWAGQLRAEGRVYYYKRVRSVLKKFRSHVGEPLPFSDLTPDLLKEHQAHMVGTLGNSVNTARVSFNVLRTVVKNAVREGVVEPGDNPFLRFVPSKETRTERSKLSAEEIAAIESLELPVGSELDRARDLFLFAMYAAGVRFGDAVRLRWRSIQRRGGALRLSYRMSKTGAPKDIKLNDWAAAIVEKYRPSGRPDPDGLVFPLLRGYDLSSPSRVVSATSSRNVVVNRELKEVARLAGVQSHVSFHVARHSFADLARRRGADVYKVSQALGHANLKVTSRYLAGFDSGAADEAVDIAFD